jgi:hypothetical protein
MDQAQCTFWYSKYKKNKQKIRNCHIDITICHIKIQNLYIFQRSVFVPGLVP